MKRLFLITAVLAILSSCVAEHQRNDAPRVAAAPLFTFVFDDGYDTDYLIAKDLFAGQGALACSAITTDWIGKPRYMNARQIVGLRDAGWEIMTHTASHPNLRSLGPLRVEDELSRSKSALEGLGVVVQNLVYPYNKSNEQVRALAARYYRSGRGGAYEFNDTVTDPYDLRSFSSRYGLEKLKRAVDRAYAERYWMIVYHHEIDAKITLTDKHGSFLQGEELSFSPSGAQGRHVRDTWFLTAGTMHLAPLAGTPLPGDMIRGVSSGATARFERMVFNERDMIADLIRYVRTKHPDMRIVTIDQALDILGMPNKVATSPKE